MFVPQPGGWLACVDLEASRTALDDPRWSHLRNEAAVLVCGYGYCRVCSACVIPLQRGVCPRCGGTESMPSKGWRAR